MIYYSHVNEDNRVERQLLASTACTAVIAVVGSGERLIALMDNTNCKKFYAVDVNEEALFLLQLKLMVLENFTVDEYWQFCGHHSTKKETRKQWFDQIKNKLIPSCKMYWEKNISSLEKGILNTGHFEKFLQRVRPSIVFFLGKNFKSVLTGSSSHSKQFPVIRWKIITRLFSLRWIYKIWGNKDVAFVSKNSAIGHIPAALNEIIYKEEAASCFMAHLIFNGHLREMQEKDLPPSLQRDVLERIKQRLVSSSISVHYYHTDILSFANKELPLLKQSIFFSVSDILSFETFNYLKELLDKTALPGNTIIWRAFLRNRVDENIDISLLHKYAELTDHTPIESTRMYQVFSIHEKTVGI